MRLNFVFSLRLQSSLETMISRIGIVGVTVISVLSGYGAVEFPLTNMSYFMTYVTFDVMYWCFSRSRQISPAQVEKAKKHVEHNMEKLLAKKKRLCLLNESTPLPTVSF